MDLSDFAILALATWRVVSFVHEDKWAGPFNILPRFRHIIGIRYDVENRKVVAARPRWRVPIADMHLCIYCMSVWYGLAAALLWLIAPRVTIYAALPFAIAAVVAIIQKVPK